MWQLFQVIFNFKTKREVAQTEGTEAEGASRKPSAWTRHLAGAEGEARALSWLCLSQAALNGPQSI